MVMHVARVGMQFLGAGLLLLVVAGCAPEKIKNSGHAGHAAKPKLELGSSAAFDRHGRLWAVYKESDHVWLRHAEAPGRAWSEPTRVNAAPEPIGADGDARPKLAFGSANEIYVTWTRPASKPYTGDIRFARSHDRGISFDAPVTVHKDRQEITHRFDALTVARDGKIFVAWIDKRDLEIAKTKRVAYRGAAIYFAVSDDRGASFRGDYKVADHVCECCRIALLARDDRTVTALWRHVFEPNIRDHALARLHSDGHIDGFRRATFDDWRIDACPHHGPSLAADGAGHMHAVWFSQAPTSAGVFYGRVGANGIKVQRRIGGDTAAHADLAVSGARIAIAWKEFDGERSQLRAMTSPDGGVSWRQHALATTADASDQPRLLARDQKFYVYWNTRLEPRSVVALP